MTILQATEMEDGYRPFNGCVESGGLPHHLQVALFAQGAALKPLLAEEGLQVDFDLEPRCSYRSA